MSGDGDYSDDDWWTRVFGGNAEDTIEHRRVRYLMRAKSDQERATQDLKIEVNRLRSQLRQLKQLSMSFLGPVLIVGIVVFVEVYRKADGAWEMSALIIAAVAAVWWIRELGRSFDELRID